MYKMYIFYNTLNFFVMWNVQNKKKNTIWQDNTVYKHFSIKLSFSIIGQDKSKLQKQIIKLLILMEMAAYLFL